MPVPPSLPAVRPLLADGSLRLEADPALLPLLERWLPLLPYGSGDSSSSSASSSASASASSPAAVVRVEAAGELRASSEGRGAPTLRLGSVSAWVDGDRVTFSGAGAGCAGEADLAAGTALLRVPGDAADPEAASWDVYSMATLSCALLLGRMGRALVHAAAVVAPGGGCWLLVGDARAGKSTTCANLISAGWPFVSDDHVVLSPARLGSRDGDSGDSGDDDDGGESGPGGAERAGGIVVEGWPRKFHLDQGWGRGAPENHRGEVDPHARWPGRWMRTAPLAGLLFPAVHRDQPTSPAPLSSADALPALLRQSPWLLADRAAAPGVLSLLQSAVELPRYTLRLGLDTWGDPALLAERLSVL